MLVDSHCHLNYLDDPAQALIDARERGISTVLCIGVDESGIEAVLELAHTETDVWASVGLHPESAGSQSTDWIEPRLHDPRVVAVGETGLDYHHVDDPAAREAQRRCFAVQLVVAQRYELPVVVHTRAAEADTADLLRAHSDVTGVLHCFTESWELASAALDLGYYISVSGIVTFNNADNVRDVARRVPLDRLLVESDAPWLAPVPHRGRSNQPAYVRDTATYLAQIRGETLEQLASATSENFLNLFQRARPAQVGNSSS